MIADLPGATRMLAGAAVGGARIEVHTAISAGDRSLDAALPLDGGPRHFGAARATSAGGDDAGHANTTDEREPKPTQ
jgi:hypothetical protein